MRPGSPTCAMSFRFRAHRGMRGIEGPGPCSGLAKNAGHARENEPKGRSFEERPSGDPFCDRRKGPMDSRFRGNDDLGSALLVSAVHLARIDWRLPAIVHTVVADDLCDAQPIVGEDRVAARALDPSVRLQVAPLTHRILVAPVRQRKDLSWLGETLEAFDRDEAIDIGEQGPQARGRVQMGVFPAGMGFCFEDHGVHARAPWSDAATGRPPPSYSRNVRSSRRMSRFSCANAKFERPSGSDFNLARY